MIRVLSRATAITFATALAVLLGTAASASAFSPDDFDDDGVPNAEDNCLVVANPSQEPGTDGPDGAACSGDQARSTLTALRFDYTYGQVDAIYRSVDAGAMPGWDVKSFGRVRCQFSVRCLGFDQDHRANHLVNEPVVPLLWSGQHWWTTETGGRFVQRTGPDRSFEWLEATVKYDSSLVDGKPAIVGIYPLEKNPPPVSNIVLENREVQSGVYLGWAWLYAVAPYVGPKVLLFHVLQDFNNPN
jgi:hypothetical protein